MSVFSSGLSDWNFFFPPLPFLSLGFTTQTFVLQVAFFFSQSSLPLFFFGF